MGRYVVTGGGGFVGRALVRHLESCGHEAIVASRGIHYSHSGTWIEYDLLRPETVANITTQQVDGVFHLAWSTVPGSADKAAGADIRTNVAGTIELFRELAECGIRTVFISSGGTIYGEAGRLPINERHPIKPVGVYGFSKAAAEEGGRLFRRTNDFDIRIARLSNPFGIEHTEGKAQGAASIFAKRILAGDPITIMGDGSIVRDYIDVDDAASAIAALMEITIDSAIEDPSFNIGSGQGVSLLELVHRLEDVTGCPADIRYTAGRDFDVACNILDISKILRLTSWRPSQDLRGGLEKLILGLKSRNAS